MTKFQHFVLTRHGLNVQSAEWYDERFKFLESITFPSLSSQSKKNFIWCIMVDNEIPSRSLERLNKLIEGHDNIKIIRVEKGDNWETKYVEPYIEPDTELFLTSRIDDDDAWSIDYVKNLHAKVFETINKYDRKSNGYLFNFNKGIVALPYRLVSMGNTIEPFIHELVLDLSSQSINILTHDIHKYNCLSAPHNKFDHYCASHKVHLVYDSANVSWLFMRHSLTASRYSLTPQNIEKTRDEREKFDVNRLKQFGVDVEKFSAMFSIQDLVAKKMPGAALRMPYTYNKHLAALLEEKKKIESRILDIEGRLKFYSNNVHNLNDNFPFKELTAKEIEIPVNIDTEDPSAIHVIGMLKLDEKEKKNRVVVMFEFDKYNEEMFAKSSIGVSKKIGPYKYMEAKPGFNCVTIKIPYPKGLTLKKAYIRTWSSGFPIYYSHFDVICNNV